MLNKAKEKRENEVTDIQKSIREDNRMTFISDTNMALKQKNPIEDYKTEWKTTEEDNIY
jgi:hypothetical protein